MKVYQLKSLICAECGKELEPQLDTRTGAIVAEAGVVSEDAMVDYRHPGNPKCSFSEYVCRVDIGPPLNAIVLGKMDWGMLPAKMVKV